MPERSQFDRLEDAIQALLAHPDVMPVDPDLAALAAIARELRDLPRENCKTELRSEIERTILMATATASKPAVRQTARPNLRVRNAAAAIDFYRKAFGARELMRFDVHGSVAHAELLIGNASFTLGEEAPQYGYPGPAALGGSPVSMQLFVDDADASIAQAVAAGARLVRPVTDEFYGDRTGSVEDPFGYLWSIATRKEDLSIEEMNRRFAALEEQQRKSRTAESYIPEGYHTLTPYLVAQDAPGLIDFVCRVFGGEQIFRTVGPAGGVHSEVRVADSMLMIGGGAPDLAWRGQTWKTALHIYVEDVDAVYRRALEAGGSSSHEPMDQPYGERSASVQDPAGNQWYIATHQGRSHVPEGQHAICVYLHPLRGEPVIQFLKRAFDAQELGKYASPEGVIHHARMRVGDSILEMGEAGGPYQPMPTMFYMYVPDADAAYHRALVAGASSIKEPANQPYGDRVAAVQDAFGNQWYIATHLN